MKNVIILIIVAIAIVMMKELIVKKVFNNSKKLINKNTQESNKKKSRNLVLQIAIKSNWSHVVFFISAILCGLNAQSSIVIMIIYLIILLFNIIWIIIQHNKNYMTFGGLENTLARHETKDLQKWINDDSIVKDNKQKRFKQDYQILEKRIGILNVACAMILNLLSIAMWIMSFTN